jgi:hypothetical protein
MFNNKFITIDIGMGEKEYSLVQLLVYYNIDIDSFNEFYEYIIDLEDNPKYYFNLFNKKETDNSIYALDDYQDLIYAKTLYKNNLIHQLNNNIKALSINTNEFKILFLNEDNSENRLNLDDTLESMLKTDKIALTLESFNKIEAILNRGYLSKEKNEELFNKLLIDYNI